jgi:hypothetical protein
MPAIKSILLMGATGRFGTDVTRALAAQKSSFSRVAVFNDTNRPASPEKEAALSTFRSQGFEIVAGHIYTLPDPFHGFDCIPMLLGNHALSQQPTIIHSAIAAGVRHFYPSEFGADLLVGQNWAQRYYRDKVLTQQHLEKCAQDTPDLGWTYLMIGRLTEWAILRHFGIDNMNHRARIYGTSEGRQSLPSTPDTIAYLIETLKEPLPEVGADFGNTKGQRRTYRTHGSSPTWREIFGTLKDISGKEYQVTYLDVESANEEEQQAIANGDVDAELAASHKLIQGQEGTLLPQPWDNDRFPAIGPESVEVVLRKAFASEKYRKAYGLERFVLVSAGCNSIETSPSTQSNHSSRQLGSAVTDRGAYRKHS